MKETETPNHSCRVLLVDDSDDIATLIKAYLDGPRTTLTVSTSGGEGIEAFKNGSFDFVLMDLQMPGVDGYQATKAIRLWERENHLRPTPVAALTAASSASAVASIFSSGCSHYLLKPITRATLLQTIGQHFANARPKYDAAEHRGTLLEKLA
jgi:CheY-like chemotaxis protein